MVLNFLLGMFSNDLAIDLGTANTLIYVKGEGIVCFVTLDRAHQPNDELKKTLMAHVAKEIGALARPDEIRFTDSLPKTRSGKIMRRLLRDIAAGRTSTGDTSTLEDYSVLAKLREEEE